MVWQALGAIGGALIGAGSARADRNAKARSDELNARGYTDARPYITDAYKRGQDALNDRLNTGFYGGDLYAGMNPMTRTAANNLYNFGTSAFGRGTDFMNVAANFGNNYADLYNAADGNTVNAAYDFAANNANPLVDRAMRDAGRTLSEDTLTKIGMGASRTGNTNSSRTGVANAIAGRGYLDREADVRANIENTLANQYMTNQNNRFANMMSANNALANTFQTGFNTGKGGIGAMSGAGEAFQTDEQNRINADRERFEGNRDFASGAIGDFMSGILGRAPMSPPGQTPNYFNPTAGALSGAYAGMGFGNKYGDQLSNLFGGFGSSPTPTPYYASGQSAMGPYTGLNML